MVLFLRIANATFKPKEHPPVLIVHLILIFGEFHEKFDCISLS